MTPPTDEPDDRPLADGERAAGPDDGSDWPAGEDASAGSDRPTGGDGTAEESETLWSLDPESERAAIEELVGETAAATTPPVGKGTDDEMRQTTELTKLGQTTGPDFGRATARERRRTHGFVRAYFLERTAKYHEFQRTLNRARIGESYDRYLTRLVSLAVLVALAGLLLGGGIGWWLVERGVGSSTATVVTASALVGTLVLGVGTWYAGIYYPRYRVGRRKRLINLVFPDAVVFMYALSESGMNLAEIIERLADADDAYGEVAAEFEVVRRDMELYGNDLYTSLRNARNITPSDSFEQFVDDLLGLLEAGGDLTRFLDDQSEQYFQRASEDQEDLLSMLALLGEVFIVGFVAAPLLVVVILIIISLLGDDMLLELGLFIYLFLPLAFLAFGLLVSGLLDPYVDRRMTLSVGDDPSPEPSQLAVKPGNGDADGSGANGTEKKHGAEAEEATAFRKFYRRKRRMDRLKNPLAFVRAEPSRALLVTVPLAVVYLAVALWQGLVPATVDGWRESPVMATNLAVVVPLVGALGPTAVLHEIDTRRRRAVVDRFPNTLYVLSSANAMGISLVDGLGVVARTTQGYYARQLQILQNDIRWNDDPSAAMLRFGNRIDVPLVSRTVKLLAEGRRSTTDLARVLRIAAEDTRNRFRLVRRRQQEMNSYVVVVLVGYLIFLGVIIILDQSYLSVVAEILEAQDDEQAAESLVADVPVDTYRLLFFHAVIVQALGAGLLSGILTDNRMASGLKYTIVLLVLAAVAFTLV